MNQIFGAIDKTKVTTGYLKEFGIRFNSIESHNGILSDTNMVDVTQWQSLYSSLYSMRVGSAASTMTAPLTVFADFKNQQTTNPDVVLLAALHYSYQQYRTTAYTGGDVTIVNDRIYDVAGRNPYGIKVAFAVAPMKQILTGNTFSFMLQSSMLYTNTGETPTEREVDFGNGQGYQSVSLNALKSVTYSSGGEKEIKTKFTYASGTSLYSHAKVYVDFVASSAQARFNGSGAYTFSVTGAPFSGASAIGDVTIETAGNDGVLDKPLIVIEGFDPDGSFNYRSFINNDRLGGINVAINSSTGLTLNQAIEDEGYDLVFINYRNGVDFIQRNAYMVEAVIEWVNTHKVGAGKNVVLGMSMGGLVARYALRHMETTGRTHQTKLYISHDVPHQGANVPLAYQAFVRHLAGESIGWPVFLGFFTIDIVDLPKLAPSLNDGLALLQSPAAQQMLIYQLSGTGTNISVNTNSPFGSFATEYKNLGYPVQNGIRNIAISNGSECGSPLNYSPYATLANVNKKIDLPYFVTNIIFTIANAWSLNPIRTLTSFLSTDTDIKAEFDMKALPNQQAQQIYNGKIFIKKKVLGFINIEEQLIGTKTFSSTSSMLPIDNAGGGVYDINRFISLPASLSQYILQQRFNFVPTYSSLDISAGTQPVIYNDVAKVYSPLDPPLAPKHTPFHNFFTNPTISESHIQFTLNNGNWLLTELKGTPAFYSCVSTCATRPAFTVSGTSLICTSGAQFSLSNVAAGATVWQATPSNLFVTSSGNGSSAFLQAASNYTIGPGNITFTISEQCGSLTNSTSFWVGAPSEVSLSVSPSYSEGNILCEHNSVTVHTSTSYPYPLSYSWTVTNGTLQVDGGMGTSMHLLRQQAKRCL
jgi:hypothetical protein